MKSYGLLLIPGPIETTIIAIGENDISDGIGLLFRSVIISWTTSDERNLTQFILKVYPAALPCSNEKDMSSGVCVIDEGDNSRELRLQLELGVEYKVTVTTVNCGTQAGNESDPISILLHGMFSMNVYLGCTIEVSLAHNHSIAHSVVHTLIGFHYIQSPDAFAAQVIGFNSCEIKVWSLYG